MKYTYFLLLYFILTACLQSRNSSSIHHAETPIPDSIYCFFPVDKGFSKFKLTTSDLSEKCTNPTGFCKYFYVISRKWIDIDSIKSFSEKNSIQKLTDSSELVIIKDREFGERHQLDSRYTNTKISNIIPDFRICHPLDEDKSDSVFVDSTTKTGLTPGYTIYVIKSGNKLILNDKWDCERQWLPAQLRHGYRSGIAINPDNEYVIFWCIAW